MISHVDALIGEIVENLNTLGLSNNTIILFTSDHGEMLGEHNILKKDPHELKDLSHDSEQKERINELHHRLLGDMDVEKLTAEIKQDQKNRLFIQHICNKDRNKKHTWDFQPFVDASKQYVRGDNNPVYC